MRTISGRIAIALLVACLSTTVHPALADPTAGAVSPNIEHIAHVPFDVGTATGLRIVGDHMYVTSWRHFSIYDVSDPVSPALLSTTPFGFQYENEDVATNGKILLFAETAPLPRVHVWDVEDKTNPQEIATLDIPLGNSIPGGEHTVSCILGCSFAYGSSGSIIDLRQPSQPKIVGNWLKVIGAKGKVHDVDEVKDGLIVTAPTDSPFEVVDVRVPTKPKILARGQAPDGGWIYHGSRWPRQGTDDFLMMSGEGSNAPLQTYDTRGWRKSKSFRKLDSYTMASGNVADGRSPKDGEAHWFQESPTFHNGGYVVAGWYSQGTRVLQIDGNGKIEEAGFFLPYVGDTWAAYWVDAETIYSVDLVRGIDVLRFDPTVAQ
jgi:hypothetical protein